MTVAFFISIFIAGVVLVACVVQHRASRQLLETISTISCERPDSAFNQKSAAKRLNEVKPIDRARKLNNQERTEILRAWQSVQAQFGCDPKTAIIYADLLVSDILCVGPRSRDARAERRFFSAAVEDRYRAAHAIAKPENARFVSFAELERAMDLYSSLLNAIVHGCEGGLEPSPKERPVRIPRNLQEHML